MNAFRFCPYGLLIAAFCFVFGLAPVEHAQAQPSGARNTDFIYRVVQHDTLIDLAQRYTNTPGNWRVLQDLNHVEDPFKLRIGRYLRIPFALIPELPSMARVTHMVGSATVNGKSLAIGNEVVEGDLLAASPTGYVTLTLEDHSVSSVTPSSAIRIERLRTFKGTGLLDAIFTMEKGSIESAVSPQNTGVGRFEIRTPVSITGVRGTRLRVHARQQGVQTEVLEGTAQLGSGAVNDPAIAQGQGAATDAQGQFLGVHTLLPAPILQPTPDNTGRVLAFSPIAGAQSYVALLTRDEAGTQFVYKQTFQQPPLAIRTPGPGKYYVFVRAIDRNGFMGNDASQPVLGQAVLTSSDGLPVRSGQGELIHLNHY